MKTDILRKKYIDFFKSKKHKVFPSDSLVPDDLSVLFTSAGMNQFKPYFLGEKKDIARATSCQKCLRTDDLAKVGQTAFHHTFFEMLGNFSFGDYFKKEAIELAWEFLVKDLNMKENDLWVSVYEDDMEAFKIWQENIGVPPGKITKLGEDANYWPANAPSRGPNGVCGPCSEIFFDKGKDVGCKRKDCDPGCDCGRFVEVWNLVFTQFNRIGKNKLEPLPQKNIDTGMGLERMVSVLQGKDSNFEIDILYPAVTLARDVLKVKKNDESATSLINAIVDHIRAATFAICDGVFPSNEERGYVVRKLIRTALWKASLLGCKQPFLHRFPMLFADLMLVPYPEIKDNEDNVKKIILAEEEKFIATLESGKKQLIAVIEKSKKEKKDTISADNLFRLYDTHGFPVELSKEVAQSKDMGVDEEGFEELLKKQRELSRKKSMFGEDIFKKKDFHLTEVSEFIGYQSPKAQARILRLISSGEDKEALSEGEQGMIVMDKTPFYPESGGQLTDKGLIKTDSGEFEVEEVFKADNAILHKGKVKKGKIKKGEAHGLIDTKRRMALARAHTATHLLQAALREVLGEHIMQQGSLVDEDEFRFDFSHFKGLTDAELIKVQDVVNDFILSADRVDKKMLSFDAAKSEGALAFFKDKYDEEVRVVSIADYSKELCGGTHLDNTSQVGSFIIISESSISSGVRRIEALVGRKAYNFSKDTLNEKEKNIRGLNKENVSLKKVKADLENEVFSLRQRDKVLKQKEQVAGIDVIIAGLPQTNPEGFLHFADGLKQALTTSFIFLFDSSGQNNVFICSVSDDLVGRGLSAKKFITQFKDELGLKGGGRKDNLIQGALSDTGEGFLGKVKKTVRKFLEQ